MASEKVQAALERLEAGIETLLQSGDWSSYLRMQSKLHRYSFQNTVLILMQCPQATQVRGFKQWQMLGRQVRKGEKGIAILAPCTYKQDAEDNSDEQDRKVLRGFKTTYVFDLSQTDGEAIPQLCKGLQGDDAGLYSQLEAFAVSRGIKVELTPLLDCNGFCRFSQNKASLIAVSNDLSPLHRCKTLAHELGHALLHGETDYSTHRPLCELEAESTAFCVLDYFGLDSSNYSFGYIANWNRDKDAIVELKQSGQAIQSAVSQIIGAIETQPAPAEMVAA